MAQETERRMRKSRGCRFDALGVFGIEKATPQMAALPVILLGIPKKCGKKRPQTKNCTEPTKGRTEFVSL